MGISNQTIAFLDQIIDLSGDFRGLKMAELGAQHMNAEGRFKGPAKEYFESLGVAHTSFDLDQVFGAEFLDLGEPIPEESNYVGAFDVVTNFGTSEHVVAHYMCFQNIHRLCQPGGLMLHTVAPPNHWAHHGRYYYPSEFFEGLAQASNYEIIELSSVAHHKHAQRDLMCALFRKAAEEAPFMPEPTFAALPIVVEEDNPFVGQYLPRHNLAGRLKRIFTRLAGRKYKL